MKIEFNDSAYWAALWSLIAAVIITITVTIGIVDVVNIDHYTSRGYTRATLQGDSYSQWVKANVDLVYTNCNCPQHAVPVAAESR